MPRITIGLGAILIVLGVVSYIATGFVSWTALIPAILGAVILIFGLVGLKKPMLGIHAALLVAILGLGGTGMNVMKLGDLFAGEAERPAAVVVSTITFVMLLVYIVMGIMNFVNNRRWKAENADQTNDAVTEAEAKN